MSRDWQEGPRDTAEAETPAVPHTPTSRTLGIDFDNTIVCYDQLFHDLARERGAIPSDLPVDKQSVRDHLRNVGQEELWIELQGIAYGPELYRAEPFPGSLEFIALSLRHGFEVFIISHKTKHPYLGPQYDLHQAAWDWLARHGAHDPPIGIPRDHVFFCLTRRSKIERILQQACSLFIDDLPEFLAEPDFPPHVQRLLFDPSAQHANESRFGRMTSWDQIQTFLLGGGESIR